MVLAVPFSAPIAPGSRFGMLHLGRAGGILDETELELLLDLETGSVFGTMSLFNQLQVAMRGPQPVMSTDVLQILGTQGWAVASGVYGKCVRVVACTDSQSSATSASTLLFYEPAPQPYR